ncbi:conserved hypothetical protein [Histoplasma capsulatum var. duboisii H88]|uniref:Uncharacterized protein n=2 Tax=Ajellomyces capsulatus TaxID=5037 RepID=F0UT16_AJEC8|nr:conserved hypothetical protein [Histoplasma capsulatum H143]EGC49043.1 conserved hypothetical protein [Histoplasma capsulatum var. duboisii H88]
MKPPESTIKAFQHISGESLTPSAKWKLRAGKRLSSLAPDVMLRIEKPHWVKEDNTQHNICLAGPDWKEARVQQLKLGIGIRKEMIANINVYKP